jgi:hypothetical protein
VQQRALTGEDGPKILAVVRMWSHASKDVLHPRVDLAYNADSMSSLLYAQLVNTDSINPVAPARLGRECLLKDVFAVLLHYGLLAVDRDFGCGSRVAPCV